MAALTIEEAAAPQIGDGPFTNEEVSLLEKRTHDESIRTDSAKKICKIYVVLHGQGVRANAKDNNMGQVGSDGKPNFFILGEGLGDDVDIKLFRMVAPGMVFMSHIDINKELRKKLFKHPLDNWLHHLKINTTLTPQQMAAAPRHEDVDPDDENWIKSRAIFRQLLQLFNKGDRLTNERLLSDFDTREAQLEFGVWFTEGKEFPPNPIISSTDKKLLGDFGTEKEITLQDLINQIIKQKRCSHYEFYIANCSPIPSDDRKNIERLRKNHEASKWIRPGQFSAVAESGENSNTFFWLNTLYIHYNRLKFYHQGKKSLNSLIEESTPSKQQNPKELPQVPPQDTIWGMMDSEERQDHYKLINGLLYMYPYFLEVAEVEAKESAYASATKAEVEVAIALAKEEIKNMMIFIIKTITTPFNEKIRRGQAHEKGASQVTKYSGTVENASGSDGASKVGPDQEGYYTLSQGVASNIAAAIRAPGRSAEIARDYTEMLQNVYGMGPGEIKNHISTNYPFKPNSADTVRQWQTLASQVGGNKLKKKVSRKKRKRRRRKKTRRKKKKKRKNKTRKKKRRRKKRTKRKK